MAMVTLDVKEAAAFLHLSPKTLYNKVEAREIPHYKLGKKVIFSEKELEKFIMERKVHTSGEIIESMSRSARRVRA